MNLAIPNSYKKYLRIGTSSWKYDSWKGQIYDPDKTYGPDDYLEDYAKILNTVEVDQWFWSLFPGAVKLPDRRQVEIYSESTPKDFLFTIKAPNSLTLTHYYSRQSKAHLDYAGKPNPHFLDPDLLKEFLETLSPLGKKLGPIMLQFEYLNRQKMPSLGAFIEKMDLFVSKAPKGYKYAIEIRNPNYMKPAFFEFLARKKMGFVFLEGYYMPPIESIFTEHEPITADFSIVRLHGGNRLEIETETGEIWNKIVSPKPESLAAAAKIVRWNFKKKVTTFVNFNNHFEGSAPLSIERFLRLLKE